MAKVRPTPVYVTTRVPVSSRSTGLEKVKPDTMKDHETKSTLRMVTCELILTGFEAIDLLALTIGEAEDVVVLEESQTVHHIPVAGCGGETRANVVAAFRPDGVTQIPYQ